MTSTVLIYLSNVIVILNDETWFRINQLPVDIQKQPAEMDIEGPSSYASCSQLTLDDKMERLEKQCILEALTKESGNRTNAAAQLGIFRFAVNKEKGKHVLWTFIVSG